MCDTLGFLSAGRGYFAKNSDRSPNEPQVVEFYPAREGLGGELSVTYMTVPRAERTHAVLLSRPAWMWGAEIGVNEHGVCIGNEAVFTKGKYGKTGLTGMDMLRLALERADTAEKAAELLIELLQRHGQGGNCGFDHNFYYDNGFLIMDRQRLFVLETAGKDWVLKEQTRASISNRLSLGSDGDRYGGEACDFRKRYTEPLYTYFSASAHRLADTRESLAAAADTADCMAALRRHRRGSDPFCKGDVGSVCMHFGGMVGDHTTASMVVELREKDILVWNTGCSLPCVSLFKPWLFGSDMVAPVFVAGAEEAKRYWLQAEQFRRALVGREIPQEFYAERNALQKRWIETAAALPREEFPAFSKRCAEEEQEFFRYWSEDKFPRRKVSADFLGRWAKKNEALEKL